jgi:hypothetical protein
VSGPPPKDQALRRRKNPPQGFELLPFEGRQGPAPEWPFPGDPSDFERRLWDKLWTLPQAVKWERARQEEIVALYVQTFTAAALAGDDPKLIAESRQLDGNLGISQKAMHALKWAIDEPEEAEIKVQPHEQLEKRVFVPKSKEENE